MQQRHPTWCIRIAVHHRDAMCDPSDHVAAFDILDRDALDKVAAEIEAADLAGLALELALWGGADLPFLTPPPTAPLAEARALLEDLGALDHGRITPHGRSLAALPLHPRLAHMLLVAGAAAAPDPGPPPPGTAVPRSGPSPSPRDAKPQLPPASPPPLPGVPPTRFGVDSCGRDSGPCHLGRRTPGSPPSPPHRRPDASSLGLD